HSSARALCDHPRNVPDDVLAALPGNGGVCMVTFVPGFLSQEIADIWIEQDRFEKQLAVEGRAAAEVERSMAQWKAEHPFGPATVGQVADHVEHVREVAGVDHVGIGGDYDGVGVMPAGMGDVSSYPVLFAELRRRGWSDGDLRRLAGRNVLRVLRAAEAVARDLQQQRGPSLVRIDRP
ncbi:MAG: dipeptidase, partial [Actinomycetes bacterium]